mgnify:FL=1
MKIAIIFGFSEPCFQLCRQTITSCWLAAQKSKIQASYSFICYECNYSYTYKNSSKFKKTIDLKASLPIDADIVQIDSSSFKWESPLPDIAIFHHFSQNYIANYDYLLFCHNDVFFREIELFDLLIEAVTDHNFDIVARPATSCITEASLRFHPSFIFISSSKFLSQKLSFINDIMIFSNEIDSYPMNLDGGAGLFASYFRKDNTSRKKPFGRIPINWFTHLRLDTDHGIDTYNILCPNTLEFNDLIKKARQFADLNVY